MGPHGQASVPAQETRGGDKVDWVKAKPGEPLPERGESFPDPDSEALPPEDLQLGLWDADEYPDPDAYGEDEP